METFLSTWDSETAIRIRDEASLTIVRERIRGIAAAAQIASDVAERAALVATELGRNQLRHAAHGLIDIRPIERARPGEPGVHRGIEVVAADRGPGIADARRALVGQPRATGSLGVGLAVVRESSLEVDFDVRRGEGTCIWARIVESGAPRRREIGIYGRAFPGEPVSGDHACFWRQGGMLFVGVCDGLGHGPVAREAADAAVAALRGQTSTSPVELLGACHRAMTATRGAVMAIARLDDSMSAIEASSIGNIAVQLTRFRQSHRFGGSSAVLDGRAGGPRARAETAVIAANDVLVMMSDGIKTQIALEEEGDLLLEHPIIIAQEIVGRFGRDNDDALVLVAR